MPASVSDRENSHFNQTLSAFGPVLFVTVTLLLSGLFHFGKLAFEGSEWNGPLSLRKPALFGISGGLTTWSIAWLMTQLQPKRYDRLLAGSLAIGLLIEVALITLQYWRGVASHFNKATTFDTVVEASMLVLILLVTLGIVYLTARTWRLRTMEPSMALAVRSGMVLLSLSCGLGILTTLLGELNIASGASYEFWGRAGVLKFPHGVALHAIQLLPMVAWIAHRLDLSSSIRLVKAALASQVLFLVYAVWQTAQGRDRFDWDAVGATLLVVVVLSGLLPTIAIAWGCASIVIRKR
jgi:hypothetical protein